MCSSPSDSYDSILPPDNSRAWPSAPPTSAAAIDRSMARTASRFFAHFVRCSSAESWRPPSTLSSLSVISSSHAPPQSIAPSRPLPSSARSANAFAGDSHQSGSSSSSAKAGVVGASGASGASSGRSSGGVPASRSAAGGRFVGVVGLLAALTPPKA